MFGFKEKNINTGISDIKMFKFLRLSNKIAKEINETLFLLYNTEKNINSNKINEIIEKINFKVLVHEKRILKRIELIENKEDEQKLKKLSLEHINIWKDIVRLLEKKETKDALIYLRHLINSLEEEKRLIEKEAY